MKLLNYASPIRFRALWFNEVVEYLSLGKLVLLIVVTFNK